MKCLKIQKMVGMLRGFFLDSEEIDYYSREITVII